MVKQCTCIFLAALILFTSCASTTMIKTEPSGAKLYIGGEPFGTTPHTYSDTKIVGTCTALRFEKEGYETLHTHLCRNEEADVGAIIGGIFFLVPFLWTMRYKPSHTFELTPKIDPPIIDTDNLELRHVKSKGDRLREIKKLHEEGILTDEEYDAQKKRILDE